MLKRLFGKRQSVQDRLLDGVIEYLDAHRNQIGARAYANLVAENAEQALSDGLESLIGPDSALYYPIDYVLFTIQTGAAVWMRYSDADDEMLARLALTTVAYLFKAEPEQAVDVISTCSDLAPAGIEAGCYISDEALAALEGADAVRGKLVRLAGQIADRIGPIILDLGAKLPKPLEAEIVAVEELIDFPID